MFQLMIELLEQGDFDVSQDDVHQAVQVDHHLAGLVREASEDVSYLRSHRRQSGQRAFPLLRHEGVCDGRPPNTRSLTYDDAYERDTVASAQAIYNHTDYNCLGLLVASTSSCNA